MKKLIALILILSAALTMSGCFPTGEKDPNVSNVSNVVSPSGSFEYEKENLKVKLDVPAAPENLPTRIKLKEKRFDFETIEKVFLDGKILNPEESEDLIHNYTDGSHLEFLEDLNMLWFNEGSVSYLGIKVKPPKTPVNYYLYVRYSHDCYREELGIGKELEGFSSQSAIDRALELCSTLGINNLGSPEVYAFDKNSYEKFKRSDRSFDSWLNDDVPFTKDNEIYVLRFKQQFGGVELAHIYDVSIDDSTVKGGKSSVGSTEVVVGVSKDDIFFFRVDNAYEAEYETVSTEPIKFGADYALGELTNYMEKKYFTDETAFEDMSVVYYPVERKEAGYVEYAAAWCFKGLQIEGESSPKWFNYNNIFFLTYNGYRKDHVFEA